MNLGLKHFDRITIKDNALMMTLIGSGIIGGAAAFPLSYISASNTIIGLCLLPFVLSICGGRRVNYFYFSVTVIFGVIAYLFHIKFFYFLALAFYFIFLLELTVGKINHLILFLIVVMSPVFLQVAVILGFPIRLYLSEWAGNVLNWVGLNIRVEGNTMLLNGFDFTVDEACMGLNMLAISMLMGIFIIAHQYRVMRLKLPMKYLLLFFVAVVVLNIISNLLRIIVLVVFKILPDHPAHEIVGILCLLLYVMIPLYYLSRPMIRYFGNPVTKLEAKKLPFTIRLKVAAGLLGLILMTIGFTINPGKSSTYIPYAEVALQGMHPVQLEGGITKLLNRDVLIYVKPIPEFYTGEHTPLLCWKGSGYTFKGIREVHIADRKIYCGVLSKNSDTLHTAWWYTNGKVHTIDQFTWRSLMLKGENRFCLVNITAKDEETLQQNLKSIFEKDLLTVNTPR